MASVLLDGVTVGSDSGLVLDDFTLRVEDGESLVILGPSGSGKTTVLRVVAGLDVPSSGDVLFNGAVVTDAPPNERDVAMVFQDSALMPFLSARRNVSFPLRLRRLPAAEVRSRVDAEAKVLDIERILHRMPRTLSAGEQQLVQAARALVRNPACFLLDEPLARMDPGTRGVMRREIALLQQGYGVTMIYATNDQAEAMAIADRVVVIDDGHIEQTGSPLDVYEEPINRFVAQFVGSPPMALFPAVVRDGFVELGGWTSAVAGVAGEVEIGVRAANWQMGGTITGTVHAMEWHGDGGIAWADLTIGRAAVEVDDRLAPGTPIAVAPKAFSVFDRATGRALAHQ